LLESPMREGVFMPSKLADYLSAGRPILALSPAAGTVADYLSAGGGLRVDPDNPAAVASALAELYDRWRDGRLELLAPPPAVAERVSPIAVVPLYERAFKQATVSGRLAA